VVKGGLFMTTTQAKAEIFLTAFNAMAKSEQNEILLKLIHNRRLREDILVRILDIAHRREVYR